MKSILVPTDFSPASQNACDYAAALAKAMHANLTLLHAYAAPFPVAEVPMITFNPEEMHEICVVQLKEECESLKKKYGIEVKYSCGMGGAVSEILDRSASADLVVMSIHGMGRLGELLVGSTTTAVMEQCQKPIIVVPEHAVFKPYEKIGLACDYDPRTELHTLEMLKFLTNHFHAQLMILQVKKREEEISVEEAVSGLHLEQQIGEIPHEFYLREGDDPTEGINTFVDDYKLDLITLMPHHRGFFDRLFHKSISKSLAFHTHIPMLTLPQL